ncbi:hypothetical protein M758_UG156500 [Ceratodon purpureus]|nr:hypothetical protein M758_UG156500 [Ceratodon purpureus]
MPLCDAAILGKGVEELIQEGNLEHALPHGRDVLIASVDNQPCAAPRALEIDCKEHETLIRVKFMMDCQLVHVIKRSLSLDTHRNAHAINLTRKSRQRNASSLVSEGLAWQVMKKEVKH